MVAHVVRCCCDIPGFLTRPRDPAPSPPRRGNLFIQFIIFAIGNTAFFFVYVLIVYFWSSVRFVPLVLVAPAAPLLIAAVMLAVFPSRQAYSSTQGDTSRRQTLMFHGFFVAFIVVQVCLMLSFFVVPYDKILAVHSITMCTVAVCICVVYIALWCGVACSLPCFCCVFELLAAASNALCSRTHNRRKLSTILSTSNIPERRHAPVVDWHKRMKKISWVAFFGTACWALKICTQVYQAWILLANNGRFPADFWWAVMLASFFFEELFTSACILILLRRRPSRDVTMISAHAMAPELSFVYNPDK